MKEKLRYYFVAFGATEGTGLSGFSSLLESWRDVQPSALRETSRLLEQLRICSAARPERLSSATATGATWRSSWVSFFGLSSDCERVVLPMHLRVQAVVSETFTTMLPIGNTFIFTSAPPDQAPSGTLGRLKFGRTQRSRGLSVHMGPSVEVLLLGYGLGCEDMSLPSRLLYK